MVASNEENESKPKITDTIKFKPDYTARQWLSQLKARIRVGVREILPSMFDAMEEPKPFRNSDEILDMRNADFQVILRRYMDTYNMRTSMFDDFLG